MFRVYLLNKDGKVIFGYSNLCEEDYLLKYKKLKDFAKGFPIGCVTYVGVFDDLKNDIVLEEKILGTKED